MEEKVYLQVRTPRTSEETPEAMIQFLSGLATLKLSFLPLLLRKPVISLEIALINQTINFVITTEKKFQTYVESQLLSQYPQALVTSLKSDYLDEIVTDKSIRLAQIKLKQQSIYPLKTYRDFKETDTISSLLGTLSKLEKDEIVVIQIVLTPVGTRWQEAGHRQASKKIQTEDGTNAPNPYARQITEKIHEQGFKTNIRVLVRSQNPALLNLISACFSIFNNPNSNSFKLRKAYLWFKTGLLKAFIKRAGANILSNQILNVSEIATLFHFPTKLLSTIHNISWVKMIFSESPENLPVAADLTEEEKQKVNFFAMTNYKNKPTNFGILKKDRRRHTYIIGKTGTGKTTLIANMAISDIRKGEGLAIIDPHGDLSEVILSYIPSYRVNDVVYLNPADLENPIHLNPLEVTDKNQKELVSSGIVSIFHKLYYHSWGPRLEYILRNSILTLLEVPNSTLVQVPELLTNQKVRRSIAQALKDPILKDFWLNEFDKMPARLQNESISPILNKVGQFLSSTMIRGIIGYPKSTIDLEEIMTNGKILIVNLSQGRMGEDNSALMGAMIITKLQLASMNRVDIPEEERRDFYLYVDEFQNFATSSFIKILSEARKFHLNLILANQYSAQIPDDVRSAIFGNVGTIMSFLVGAEDAPYLSKEFGERFKQEDLLSLGSFQLLIKMAIDDVTCPPFLAQSLPLLLSTTQNKEKVIRISKGRYGKKPKLETNRISSPILSPGIDQKSFPSSGSIAFTNQE